MILVFGTICLDRMRKVAFLPGPGGYVSVQEESVKLGGEAANTAYALSQWGVPHRLVGNAVEQRVQDRLVQQGLSLEHVSKVEAKAPVCDIYVTPDGQRTMFGVGFDKMAETINLDELDFSTVTWFTMDMNFGELGWEAAARAQSAGVRRYIMDAEPLGSLAEGDIWQSSTDWVGTRGHKTANLKWAKDRSSAWGATVILTDSGRELVVAHPGGQARAYPTFPPPLESSGGIGERDSTGAGDRFRAGMLYGLHALWPMSECLAFAASAASLKLAHPGGIALVPKVSEVNAYRRSHRSVDAFFGLQ